MIIIIYNVIIIEKPKNTQTKQISCAQNILPAISRSTPTA